MNMEDGLLRNLEIKRSWVMVWDEGNEAVRPSKGNKRNLKIKRCIGTINSLEEIIEGKEKYYVHVCTEIIIL